MIVKLIEQVYSFLWGDLLQIPLPGGGSVGISLLIILLIPAGIYFTIRTRVLPIRLFPDMVTVLTERRQEQSVYFSDIDRIDSNPCRNGKSGRRCCGSIRRWCGSYILDVGDSADRFFDSIYRSNTCSDS